jgi:hypothetical protein
LRDRHLVARELAEGSAMKAELFHSRSEAARHAARQLSAAAALPLDAADEIVTATALVAETPAPPVPPAPRLSPALVPGARFVIRNEELLSVSRFLDLLKAALSLVIGVAALGTAAGIKAIVDGVQGFYTTFAAIVAAGARLDAAEFAVLWALKREGPASPAELAGRLRGEAQAPGEGAVAAILRKYERRDGGGFVRADADGRWHLDGV